MVEIIQWIQNTQTQTERPSTSMEEWSTTWSGMPNTTLMETKKSQEVINSQEKLITVEEISNVKKKKIIVKFSPHLNSDFSLVTL